MSESGRFVLAATLLAVLGHVAPAVEPPQLPSTQSEEMLPPIRPLKEAAAPPTMQLHDLVQLSLSRHPRLAQAGFDIQAAQGREKQAGLYPNPTVSINLDEMSDVQGRGGIITAPLISQEIVTSGKRKLDRAVANREVNRAELELAVRRYELMSSIRAGFFDALASQRRLDILTELVGLATQSYEQADKLLKSRVISELQVIQLRVELNRARTEREAAEQERDAALRRLAATSSVPEVLSTTLGGSLDTPLPDYDFNTALARMAEAHPEVVSAHVGIDRAQLALQRANAQATPNVTIGAGYVRQNQNRSNDWTLQLSVPLPAWNRNQGNRLAAQAEVGRAMQEVGRAQFDLGRRLATSHGEYSASRKRAERYRDSILPDARQTYQLSLQGYKGGQFEYLTVLQAQRSLIEANLEYIRALAEAWKAAAEISGLLLEEQWPALPIPQPAVPRK